MHAVAVREAASLDDLGGLAAVVRAVWQDDMAPVNLARAIQHAGGYASVAVAEGGVVGGSLGFLGRDDHGATILHSHITAALPDATNRGLGFALKQHQRAWCLERGVETVVWTFDPLVRRNAYFNLTKLGAEATAYYVNFYGAMPDALNEGDETDRVVATWRLTSDRAVAAAEGRPEKPSVDDGVVVLDMDDDGRPAVIPGDEAATALARVPEDIIALRQRDPAAGRAWRLAVRATVGAALANGYVGTAMTTDGWYVVRRP